ncbi:CYTH domain-containing protein [Psychrosphaera aestuarii]|uniref:CYTH domain-containing protein n=1 Tax=Psychrosphaera aestuarii TaxID=1266052 RepID=UPI001B341C07|nr:CYTH domain-containing protein [Psychrosphaera aestuarii]
MEIELKFLIQPDLVAKFISALSSSHFNITTTHQKQLRNGYFDTDDQTLRSFDMGLRIRSSKFSNGHIEAEQTVKLAGQDIGGLHRRPEFNVELPTPVNLVADLSLFDDNIWPTGFVVNDIQPNLKLLFETDFERTTWLVEMPSGTVIECVLDQGVIRSGSQESIISEIELEFVSGQEKDLFNLAHYINSQVDVRLGFLSKAARGYQLLTGKMLKCTDLNRIELPENVEFETALIQASSEALKFVQHNEQVFCSSMSPKALRKVIDGWSLIIHILQLFSSALPQTQIEHFIEAFKSIRHQHKWVDGFYQLNQLVSRKSPYRKEIENSEHLSELMAQQQLPESKLMKAVGFFSTTEYNQLVVNFVEWLSQKQWRQSMPLENLGLLKEPLVEFSNLWLEKAWQNVQVALANYTNNSDKANLVALYWPLVESILTGITLGSLYAEQGESMHNSQHDLLVGCEEFLLLTRLERLLTVDAQDSENNDTSLNAAVSSEYLAWVKGKQDSLNKALAASIGSISQIKPYW